MTSKASQQPASSASNISAPAAPSYASAVGATKKPSSTPTATAPNQPVVVAGTTKEAPNHAKSSSVSPMNGRPNVMPAIPAVANGTVQGTSANSQPEHQRKSSVTMSATGPNSYSTNGGSTGAKASIQFGYQESPAITHSTPQPPSAPIPIPTGNRGVTDPRHSPSPIPLPSASGGRPPSSAAPSAATLNFGSFDGDRSHMRNPSASHDPTTLGPQHHTHIRRESNVSDVSNHNGPPPGGPTRGNFSGGNRGGRPYNGGFNNQSMGYPPANNYRGQQGNQPRGGMPANFAGNNRQQHHYQNQANRSPALSAAIPQPVAANMPPYYYGQPPVGPSQAYYPPPYDPRNPMPPMAQMAYPGYPNMHQPASPLHNYQQPFMPSPYNAPVAAQPMSRSNSSQISEQRPGSGAGQAPVPVPQGTPQQQAAQLKQGPNPSPHFTRPVKRSAAIQIKNEHGEALDFKSLKPTAPASPATTSQQSRTPPVVSSTPTPPPKASTPKPLVSSHGRTDSTSNSKTAEEKRNEFMEKIKQTATGDKAKEDDTTKTAVEQVEVPNKSVSEPAAEPVKDVPAPQADVPKPTEDKTEPVDSTADAPKPSSDDPDEDEMERIIREMEEADARREAEEAEMNKKRQAEKETQKKAEEEARAANAAENDRKLREQEREMERLEEEREAKRAAERAPTEESSKAKDDEVNEATGKLGNLSLAEKQSSAAGAKTGPGGRAPKPQALNLAPLNTKAVEAPQPSAALQSLKTARLLDIMKPDIYPPGINSPNPALNAAVEKKGKSFKYDPAFLLQFKTVFTEQPSDDFNSQVKSLIGDGDGGRSASHRSAGGSGRQATRNSSTSSFPMGSFGTSQALPSGTTSAQRFEMSNKGMGGMGGSRPGMTPISSFQRPGGAFAGGNQMSRTPSSNMGSMPHSPRQSSRRNASKPSTLNHKSESQAAKNMPLTAGLKIDALQTSSTGWKPLSISKSAAPSNVTTASGLMDPAMVQRKVKAALNKMTPDNFDRISDQILEIAGQSKEENDGRTLRQVIQLTFEKACDEAHWASMYAKFCKKMLDTMSPEIRDENIKDRNGNLVSGGALFRKYLLNRCQEEFERGWSVQLPEQGADGDRKTEAAALLTEEYYKAAAAKRKGLGLVQFIGELYKLAMLTERIMHECVRKLVDYTGIPDEAEVESLCKLLRTIGWNLDNAEKGKPMMDVYFARIQTMIDLQGMPSRLKFMLMDIMDLRRNNWQSKEANKGPKTLEEVRAEAEAAAAQKAAESARNNQRTGGGRAPLGRGDARHMQGGYPQQPTNQVGMDDLRRLKGGASRVASTNLTLGPMSLLGSRSNSGRRLGAVSRGPDDSGASSRTGTPPVRDAPTSTNSFGLLATMDSEHPGSPPSTAASPALAKATPETSGVSDKGGN